MIHTTIGVYLNGDYKTNGVPSHDLARHIEYNITFRPGRALIVDNHIIYEGYYGISGREELKKMIEEKFKNIRMERDTAPYQ